MEVLVIMRRVLAASKTSCPSSLSGPVGREVDRFSRLSFREYQKTLEQCQRQGLNVSQATLQKGVFYIIYRNCTLTTTYRDGMVNHCKMNAEYNLTVSLYLSSGAPW